MSVGPLGNTPALSGAQNDAASQVRRSRADSKSEQAQSLGEAEVDQEASDRDADGRKIWEFAEQGEEKEDATGVQDESTSPRQAKDPTGDCGGLLDLSG